MDQYNVNIKRNLSDEVFSFNKHLRTCEGENDFQHIVINSPEPLVFKNMLDWKMLQWDLPEWQKTFGNEQLKFRIGKNLFTKEPQFENYTKTTTGTFEDLINRKLINEEEWMYFDYKYLKQHLRQFEELRNDISWSKFGFPNLTADDCTIWIGSQGAHTPCHVDSYGCNLVAQIYGRKQWVLFSPNENLKPTRIPYEESSIYSKRNLFSPNITDFRDVSNCRRIILNPGDVLLVPNKWWHYVENLDLAISINTWIPLEKDTGERVSEGIIQLLLKQLSGPSIKYKTNIYLNPEIEEEVGQLTFGEALDVVYTTAEMYDDFLDTTSEDDRTVVDISNENIETIPVLSKKEFHLFLKSQADRFCKSVVLAPPKPLQVEKYLKFVEAVLNPDVVAVIREKLCE